MIIRDYLFGGLVFRIESLEPVIESGFYHMFRTVDAESPDIVIRIIRSDLPSFIQDHPQIAHHFSIKRDGAVFTYTCFSDNDRPEKTPYACEARRGGSITLYIDFDGALWETMIFDAVSFSDIMIEHSAAVLHSSIIGIGNDGVLFAGGKGQGKSTQAELWQIYNDAVIINGDRTLVRPYESGFTAYGIPFCGSSKICLNESRRITAIVFPEKGTENRSERLSPFDSFKRIIGCISFTRTDVAAQENAVSAAGRIAEGLPCYRLVCTPDERAVLTLRECLGI